MAADIQGSPGSLVRVLIYDIFENAFRFYRMGYASAEATVFFAIVLLLTLAQFRVLRSQTGSSGGGPAPDVSTCTNYPIAQ
jgi:multiple sugar transport system permease protein